jgi:hypothetical protein
LSASTGRVSLLPVFSPPFPLRGSDAFSRVSAESAFCCGTRRFSRVSRALTEPRPNLLDLRLDPLLLQFKTFESRLKHQRIIPCTGILRHNST